MSSQPKNILVTNRGEIALRIMRTIRKMGHRPIGIYSQVDQDAPHVQMSAEAFCVGEAESSQSYLNVEKLLKICERANVDMVHPGYGFLAENADFAQTLAEHNITFIGPSPECIRQMGDKILARKAASKAGLPMVPGTQDLKSASTAIKHAQDIGYPVLLKAKAGGGGKGMRKVDAEEDMDKAFSMATSEAAKAFGNGTMYMEKCLVKPRHIEVQVFCDHHGNVYTLGDRECSLQRRHQKIIEEAPAFGLSNELREKMREVSVALCKQVDYRGAGTIEYLVDKDENFYFLEMNTRLQVEHPVTEWVTGLDLVELQIRAALDETVILEPRISGFAVEARIYAEDPDQNFIPQPGHIHEIIWPLGPFVRIDTGVTSGMEISNHYDPMIAKISTFGATRAHALDHMKVALDELIVTGTMTNAEFLKNIVVHPAYQANDVSTTFVEDNMPFEPAHAPTSKELAAALACMFEDRLSNHQPSKQVSMWWTSRLPRFQWYR